MESIFNEYSQRWIIEVKRTNNAALYCIILIYYDILIIYSMITSITTVGKIFFPQMPCIIDYISICIYHGIQWNLYDKFIIFESNCEDALRVHYASATRLYPSEVR